LAVPVALPYTRRAFPRRAPTPKEDPLSSQHLHTEAPETVDTVDGLKHFLIYIDESGIHSGSRYYGWGSLWIPAENLKPLAELLSKLKRDHRFQGELKWSKVNGARQRFAMDLMDAFFTHNWMMCHALLIRNDEIALNRFNGDLTKARLHHLTTLLRSKIGRFGAPEKAYHLRADPLPSPYAKEHEKFRNIVGHQLAPAATGGLRSAEVRDSKTCAGIQLADLLLGATLAPWQGAVAAEGPKAEVSAHLYSRIGWPDHRAGTFAKEWKFNLWWLCSDDEDRPVAARGCAHHFRTPEYPQRRRDPPQPGGGRGPGPPAAGSR
jgi:hypothetical protein